jgi:hypothetical protein
VLVSRTACTMTVKRPWLTGARPCQVSVKDPARALTLAGVRVYLTGAAR